MIVYLNTYLKTDRKHSALIEKNNGDIRMRQDKYHIAIKHYKSALKWLKILIDEKILTNEKDVDLYVDQIGVIFIVY